MINSPRQSFTDLNIALAPDLIGVYALWYESGLVYYGRAEGLGGIRARLQAHKRGDEGRCTQISSYFQVEVCLNPSARECELILEYYRLYGRFPLCNDRAA